jgi:hypothetical protein
MLIDRYMGEWEVDEKHRIHIDAPAERVYAAIRTADLAASPIVRVLFAMRGIPLLLTRGRQALETMRERARARITLADFEREGFSVLEEDFPTELLIGLEGQFWRPSGGIRAVDRSTFATPPPPGQARAAWNFSLEPDPLGGCILSTETRVRCSDPATRRRFRLYWTLVRPGSGLIRRMMLRAIRREAESPRASESARAG